ncbi:MAR-binding filament-like protein 1-1 isoform X2 [Juglans microcarpa x Juglans regia]|uniref:MAR-binding filament-like protein 1-1 isoform X2 n=1 Tax=Juglans microcarpa x Juglans regia TaxID=2249226 RepID=UPI001B7E8D84|nr:MAR-binding filament-like protein 1-1 isoform X2 [Juglans microcarpa x Juglans regia]
MGFMTGSPCYLHPPPLCQSRLPSSSSQSTFLYSCSRNAGTKRKNVAPMASLQREDPKDGVHCKRRAILFVGISILPLLQLTARALERVGARKAARGRRQIREKAENRDFNLNESGLKKQEENQEEKQALQIDAPPNPLQSAAALNPLQRDAPPNPLQRDVPPNNVLSLLNGLGIFSSGVLGALYALAQREKTAQNAEIESMKSQLKEKEAAIVSSEKNFESKLLNEQEERTKQLRKVKEEQQSLLSQLNSANSTITGLGQELKREKILIEELKFQIQSLETSISMARDDKKALEENLKERLYSITVLQERSNLLSLELKDKEENVRSLSSSLAEKELELNNLNFIYKQTKDDLARAHSQIQKLELEYLKTRKELESTNSTVDELNSRASSLTFDRDESKRKLDVIQEEYDDLRLSSEKKAALNAKLLGEKEEELQQLKQKLEHAVNEVSGNQAIISDLTQERDNLRKMLDIELRKVKHLKHELQSTKESLGKSTDEVSDLTNQLQQARELCTELEGEISRVQTRFVEVRESNQRSLDEAKLSNEMLAGELAAVKECLTKKEEELQIASHELAGMVENRDSLQKELVDLYKKAETAASDLIEEKKAVSSLNKAVQAWEKRILKEKEARKSLEKFLEEATKSLDEMNRKSLILSGELEKANSQISSLEDGKEVLYKSLAEQKNISKEARENLEDAHNLVMRVRKERESLEKRANKLEEGLASAKGEILRLKSQINSSKSLVNNQQQQPKQGEAEGTVTVTPRRNSRRKKASSQ